MADAALVATIVVFFVVAALLVRVLGRVTAAADIEPEAEAPAPDRHPEPRS